MDKDWKNFEEYERNCRWPHNGCQWKCGSWCPMSEDAEAVENGTEALCPTAEHLNSHLKDYQKT